MTRPFFFDARKAPDTGIGRYIRGLVPHLLNQHPGRKYHFLLPPGLDLATLGWSSDSTSAETSRARNYTIRETIELPARVARSRPSLVHCPHYTVPIVSTSPRVVTIHDLIHLRFPQHPRNSPADLYVRFMLRRALACERIIVPSESTKADLMTLLGADPARVRVIPEAAETLFRHLPDRAMCRAVAAGFGLTGDFLMYVGMWKPHKNVLLLLRAFARFVRSTSWGGCLAIVGRPDPKHPEVLETIKALQLQERVVVTGFVPDDKLPALYNAALAVVLPSLYEGFGLTVLEAMACGTPVLSTDTSSIPEVAGNAAILIPPNDEGALCQALRVLCTEADLRRRLSAEGMRRAAQFSWERAARETLRTYEEVSPIAADGRPVRTA